MFKKNSHGIFCFCPLCRAKRRTSLFHNILISSLALITVYQSIITIFNFTRLHCFLLLIESIIFSFLVVRTLF